MRSSYESFQRKMRMRGDMDSSSCFASTIAFLTQLLLLLVDMKCFSVRGFQRKLLLRLDRSSKSRSEVVVVGQGNLQSVKCACCALLKYLVRAVIRKAPLQHLVAVWCPQERRMVRLCQRQVVEHQASPIQDRFAGAEILHGQDDKICNLPNHFVQLFRDAFVDIAKVLLIFSTFFGEIDRCEMRKRQG